MGYAARAQIGGLNRCSIPASGVDPQHLHRLILDLNGLCNRVLNARVVTWVEKIFQAGQLHTSILQNGTQLS